MSKSEEPRSTMIPPGRYVGQIFLPSALALVLVAQAAAFGAFSQPVCILYARIPANVSEIVGAASFLAENGGRRQRLDAVAVLGHYGMRCPTRQRLFGARVAGRLSDPEPSVRARALAALTAWGPNAAIHEPLVRARLTDPAQVVWANAIEATLVIRHGYVRSLDDEGCEELKEEWVEAAEARARSFIPLPRWEPFVP